MLGSSKAPLVARWWTRKFVMDNGFGFGVLGGREIDSDSGRAKDICYCAFSYVLFEVGFAVVPTGFDCGYTSHCWSLEKRLIRMSRCDRPGDEGNHARMLVLGVCGRTNLFLFFQWDAERSSLMLPQGARRSDISVNMATKMTSSQGLG